MRDRDQIILENLYGKIYEEDQESKGGYQNFVKDLLDSFVLIKAKEEGSLRGFNTFKSKDNESKATFEKTPFDPPDEIIISTIYTPPSERGSGSASKLLKQIIEIADKNSVKLKLEPMSVTELIKDNEEFISNKKLSDWYKRYGFEQIEKGSDSWLIRYPNK